jgi:hypothetical protein
MEEDNFRFMAVKAVMGIIMGSKIQNKKKHHSAYLL